MVELIENETFDPSVSVEIWIDFCSYFKPNKYIAEMYKLIKEKLEIKEKNYKQDRIWNG